MTHYTTIQFVEPQPRLRWLDRIKSKFSKRVVSEASKNFKEKRDKVINHALAAANASVEESVKRMGFTCNESFGMEVKFPLRFSYDMDVETFKAAVDLEIGGVFERLVDKIRAAGLDPNTGKFNVIAGYCGEKGDVTIYWKPN